MRDWRKILNGQQRDPLASLIRGALFGSKQALQRHYPDSKHAITIIVGRKIESVNVPVISVGNLTVGGTGKTPAVAMIARMLREYGLRVSIVSRGYRSGEEGTNDEAKELERLLPDVPHIQNPNRYQAALLAQDETCDSSGFDG